MSKFSMLLSDTFEHILTCANVTVAECTAKQRASYRQLPACGLYEGTRVRNTYVSQAEQ